MEQKQTIKLSGIVRNLPDNTVPDGTMHELINLRPRDGALRPVGQKTPTVIVARDIRHIHRVSNSIIVYIGSSEDGGTLSYWVSVNDTLGSEVTTDIIIPGNGAPVKFANLKNTVMVSCHTIEQLALMVFDEDANTYTIFDSIDRFFPRDIPNFNVQRVAVAADNDTNTFEAPYTVNLNDALMAEYVKMQRSREDKGYLSGKVLIRFAWELFDGTMVKHTVPDLTRTSDLEVTYSTESSLFNNEGGWEISTAFTAYKLQFYLAGDSGWLTAFQDKYKNIIRSLKIYVSRPKSPDEDITKDERFEKIIKDNDGLVGKMLNKIERIFDLAELKDYSPDPETEQYYLLREIKISDLTASTWTDIIDTTEEDISVQNLSTREQLTVDNFTHHQLFANRLFTYNERIFLADIKNTLLQGFPVVGLFSSWSTVTGANYEVAMEYEIIVAGNKTLRTISAWTTLNYYSNASPLALEFSIRRSYVPGGGMLGEYGYFGYPDARATKVRVLVRQNNVTYIAAERELKSYPGQNYSIVKGFEVSSPLYAMTSYTPSYVPSSWSYYDTNRVQATELNNPFYFPAINSYRLGLGQVLGMATNAIALSQGQYGQFPVFVFCSDGIYAMNIGTGETLINTISPLSREVCSNPESITPIDAGAAFVSARGLFVIAGTAKPELSEAAEGKHTSRITALPAYDTVCNDASYYQIRSLLCTTDFLSYLTNAVIGYDYMHNEIIVSNASYPYSWVFSIDHKLWFKISESFVRFVNDYPLCYGIKAKEESPATVTIKNGRLYNWHAVNDARGLAPVGTHIPDNDEFQELIDYLGSGGGGKLKAVDESWLAPNTGASNDSGFTALCSNFRYDTGDFAGDVDQEGMIAYFYSTELNGDAPCFLFLSYDSDEAVLLFANYAGGGDDLKNNAVSIRCLLDDPASWKEGDTITDTDGNVYNTVKIGEQVWLKQNLAVTKYRDGTSIPNVTDSSAWAGLSTGAMCSYNNDDNNI